MAAQLATQSLRLAGAIEWVAHHSFDEPERSQGPSTVDSRPVFEVMQEAHVHDGLAHKLAIGLAHAQASPSLWRSSSTAITSPSPAAVRSTASSSRWAFFGDRSR